VNRIKPKSQTWCPRLSRIVE